MSSILNEILNTFGLEGAVDDSFIREIISDFSYQGIDITAILTLIKTKLMNNTSSKKDLVVLIAIGLTRGNKISKIKKTLTVDAAKKFSTAVKLFDIKESLEGSTSKTSALTLSRLRVAMPQVAIQILSHPNITRPVSSEELEGLLGVAFPLVFRDNCVASLIPKEATGEMTESLINSCLICIWLYCVLESEKLIKKGDRLDSLTNRANRAKTFLMTSWMSPHISTDMRKAASNAYFSPQKDMISECCRAILIYLTNEGIAAPSFMDLESE